MLAETVIYRNDEGRDLAAIITRVYSDDTADLTVFLQQGQLFLGGVEKQVVDGREILNNTWRERS